MKFIFLRGDSYIGKLSNDPAFFLCRGIRASGANANAIKSLIGHILGTGEIRKGCCIETLRRIGCSRIDCGFLHITVAIMILPRLAFHLFY